MGCCKWICLLLATLAIHGIASTVQALHLWYPSWPLEKATESCLVKTVISPSTLNHNPLRYRSHYRKKKEKSFGQKVKLFFLEPWICRTNLSNELKATTNHRASCSNCIWPLFLTIIKTNVWTGTPPKQSAAEGPSWGVAGRAHHSRHAHHHCTAVTIAVTVEVT